MIPSGQPSNMDSRGAEHESTAVLSKPERTNGRKPGDDPIRTPRGDFEMPRIKMLLLLSVAFGFGLVAGQTDLVTTRYLAAQVTEDPSADTIDSIKKSIEALNVTMGALQSEQRYTSAIQGVNSFAISVGGVDALSDLEDGRGVDPETYAALYAGFASDDIRPHLGEDENGRLTYKNKLVRMYSTGRLKRLFAARANYQGFEF